MSNNKVLLRLHKAKESIDVRVNALRIKIESSYTWQKYAKALQQQEGLDKQIKGYLLEQTRTYVISEFKCVTGHEWDSENQSYLIVPNNTPEISYVGETCKTKSGLFITWKDKHLSKSSYVEGVLLGSGSNEKEAWLMAFLEWDCLEDWQRNEFLN